MATKRTGTAKNGTDAFNTSRETVEAAVKAGAETATKTYEQAVELTKDNFQKASTYAFRGYDDAADFNRESLDAFVESSNAVAKGFEEMSRQFAAYTQGLMEDNLAHAKRLFSARSLPEVMDIQAAWAKDCFDDVVAEGTRAQERSIKAFSEATGPLNSRLNAAFEKIAKPLAG